MEIILEVYYCVAKRFFKVYAESQNKVVVGSAFHVKFPHLETRLQRVSNFLK